MVRGKQGAKGKKQRVDGTGMVRSRPEPEHDIRKGPFRSWRIVRKRLYKNPPLSRTLSGYSLSALRRTQRSYIWLKWHSLCPNGPLYPSYGRFVRENCGARSRLDRSITVVQKKTSTPGD